MRLNTLKVVLVLLAMIQIGWLISAECIEGASTEPTMHDRIYFFEHRLLPQWTHKTKGAFFDDLMNDRTEKMKSAAVEIVGEEFWKGITIRKFNERKAVLLIFPIPKETPEYYFVYIASTENGYKYFTYEKTFDLQGTGNKGVVGAWSMDGSHINMGARKYEDVDSFISEIEKSP
jgi:hypothetical protein